MNLLIRLVVSTLAVLAASKIVAGITVDSTVTALVVAIVLGLLNTFVAPVLKFLTLPITILTLGLFYLLINVAMVFLTSYLVEGFQVEGFVAAFLFGLVVSLVSWLLGLFLD